MSRLPLIITAALVLLTGPATASFWDRLGDLVPRLTSQVSADGSPQPIDKGSSTDLGLGMDPDG